MGLFNPKICSEKDNTSREIEIKYTNVFEIMENWGLI